MKQNLFNKLWLRVGMIVAIMTTALAGTAWGQSTATLQITSSVTSQGNLTDDRSNSWAFTTDGELTGSNSYIQAGTNKKEVSYIRLTTSAFSSKKITKVQVWGTSKANTNVSAKVIIGTTTIGTSSVYTSQTASSGGTEFSVNNTNEVTGDLTIEISRASSATGAIYFNKAIVTYDDGGSTPQVISYDKNSVEVTYGEENSVVWPVLSNPGNVEVIYDSSDENVATVNATGAVTLIKPGTTTITATDGDNDASFDITYNKAAHGLSYETKSYTVKPGSSFATPTLTNPHNLTVTYTSSDTDVATVNATTGAVEILLVGTTTIRATFAGNDYYNAGYTTYTINVSNKDFNAAGSWIKVTDASELVEGQKYLIGNVDGTALMGGQTANNRSAVSVTPSEGIITITDEAVEPIILEGETGAWYLESSVGYLYAASSSSNYLRSETQQDDNANAKITVTNTDATIQFQGTNTRNLLRYNSNSSCFACYSSGQAAVALYKEYVAPSVATPTFSVASGTYIETQNVTISCETAGATIYYTTDGSTPSATNGTQGTSVTISQTTTLKAIAIKDGESSAVATAEYTFPVVYSTIPAIFAAATSTATDVNITFGGWVVSAVHSNNAYLTDNQGNGLIIYATDHGFQAGDVLTGTVSCKLQLYRGSAELTELTTSTTGLSVTQNGTVTEQNIAINELSGVNTGALVAYEGLTFNGTALVDANSNTITPYTTLYEGTFENGKTYNVTGIYLQYNSTKEILPRSAADIEEVTNTIAVTGVSLDESSLTMEIGDTETLTATVTPANATNKTVTWSSDDTDVATVANGVVTAVAAGTCTITVTTTDGSFTATCDVTVNSAASSSSDATITFDFTDTAWGFPDSYETDEANYTYGGYTLIFGASNNGHKKMVSSGNQTGVIFGKEGATLTLPAFDFNVSKIKVTGISGASGKVTYNVFVGSDEVSTEVTGAIGVSEFAIDSENQSANTVYTLKVTNANNCQISKIEVFGYESVEVTSAGYATYCSENALDFTGTAITAYVGTVDTNKKLTFTPINQVPANTGLLLVADGGATVDVPVIASADPVQNNCLTGTISGKTLDAEDYILNVVNGAAGFYKAGSYTSLAAHRAYISKTVGQGVKGFVIDFDDDATGISLMEDGRSQMEDDVIYNVAGQRISKMQKGINIVNGKKVLK